MSVEFDPYAFENKVRIMVLELLNPTARRMMDLQESIEEVFRHDSLHQKRLDTMEFNWSTFQSKITLIDESYKISQDLKSNNTIFESEINQKIQSISGNVQKAVHKTEDLSMKVLTIDENFRSARTEISEYANTVNMIKSSIIGEHKNLVQFVEKQMAETKKLWMTTSDRLNKAEHAVLAFTDNALPGMLADVEKNLRLMKELKRDTKENLSKKVDLSELAKLRKTWQFDQEKLKELIKGSNEYAEKIEDYIGKFLPIESWNAVSEAICKLNPKHLKAFVELDEAKMEFLKTESGGERVKIEDLAEKALQSYNDHIARREIMKIEIEKAELEKLTTLNRARNGSSNRRVVYDSSSDSKQQRKRKHKGRQGHELLEVPSKDQFPIPTSRDQSSSDLNNAEDFQSKPNLIEEVEEKSQEVTKIEEPETKQEENKEDDQKLEVIEHMEVDKIENNSFFGLFQRSPTGSQLSESELQPATPSYHNRPSKVDLSEIEAELEILKTQDSEIRTELRDLSSNFDQSKETLEKTRLKLEQFIENLTQQQSNFETSVMVNINLLHEEIKQIIMRNKQEKTDIVKQISLYHNEQKLSGSSIERLEGSIGNFSDLIVSVAEVAKIVHLLTAQEEEDRQSLQLMGYSESKGQKAYISLKSDCMSCSGSNPTVLTAFKMACLNYSPSGIKYKHRNYTRKQLITVLGTISNGIWSQITNKVPRFSSEFGTYQSNLSLAEDTSQVPVRHKYNRSQFIELPSLNSKLFSDISDTPFSSTREIKKLN